MKLIKDNHYAATSLKNMDYTMFTTIPISLSYVDICVFMVANRATRFVLLSIFYTNRQRWLVFSVTPSTFSTNCLGSLYSSNDTSSHEGGRNCTKNCSYNFRSLSDSGSGRPRQFVWRIGMTWKQKPFSVSRSSM